MKLFLYYALHSMKNSLKKLFKSWVLLFVVICMIGGLMVGLFIGGLGRLIEDNAGTQEEEQLPEETIEINVPVDEAPIKDIVELVAGGVILLLATLSALGADKSGGQIFLPADVNLLFPSPMKPQSVLLFRFATQMGVSIAASFYILFQIPNLMRAGLTAGGALCVIFGWILTVLTANQVKMLCYLGGSNRPWLKRNLRRIIYVILLAIVGGYVLYKNSHEGNWWEAALGYFNSTASRWIPFIGWIKGFIRAAIENRPAQAAVFLGLVLVCGILLTWLIWHMKADFYEDAMTKSEEMAELLAAAQSSENGVAVVRRKKDCSERLRRDGMTKGFGANVFFFKALYNRFRFAHLSFFTKTMEYYLAVGIITAFVCRFGFKTTTYYPIVILLAVSVFFRSLGNALQEDTKMAYFVLIPENNWNKLCWSLLGDTFNCFLDILPGLVIGLIVQGAPLFPAVLWILVMITLNAYATAVGCFIGLTSPSGTGKTLKQMAQVIFIYFGLLPDIILIVVLTVLHLPVLAVFLVSVLNTLLAGLFMYFSSAVLG